MQFVKLSDARIINLDEISYVDIGAPCTADGDPAGGCVRFGGGGLKNESLALESLELDAKENTAFKTLKLFNGYTAQFDRYIINLQKISNIQITRPPLTVTVYFGHQTERPGSVVLERELARKFLKYYSAILNLPEEGV